MLQIPGRVARDLRVNLVRHPNMGAYGIEGWYPSETDTVLTDNQNHLRVVAPDGTGGAWTDLPGIGGGYYLVQARVWSATAATISIGISLFNPADDTLLNGYPYATAVPAQVPASSVGTVIWAAVWVPNWYGPTDGRLEISSTTSTTAFHVDEVSAERIDLRDAYVGDVNRWNWAMNPGPTVSAYPSGYEAVPSTNTTVTNQGGGATGAAFFPPSYVQLTATGATATVQALRGRGFRTFAKAGDLIYGSVVGQRSTGNLRARLVIEQGGSPVGTAQSAYALATSGGGTTFVTPSVAIPADGDYTILVYLESDTALSAAQFIRGWRWKMGNDTGYFDGSFPGDGRTFYAWGTDGAAQVADDAVAAPVTRPGYFDGDMHEDTVSTGWGTPWEGLAVDSRWLGPAGNSQSVLYAVGETYWSTDDTNTTPRATMGVAVNGEGSFADQEASKYAGRIRISRDLTGGNLPGQVRGATGFSKASGEVSIGLPDRSPWRGGPLVPGGTVYINLDPGLTLPEATIASGRTSPVFLGEYRLNDFGATTARSAEVTSSIEQYAPRLGRPVVLPALLATTDVGRGGLDATYAMDLILRRAGYFVTPDSAAGTNAEGVVPLVSATMQGSLLAEVGSLTEHHLPGDPSFDTADGYVVWAPPEPDSADYIPAPWLLDEPQHAEEGTVLIGIDFDMRNPAGAVVLELVGALIPIPEESEAQYTARLSSSIARITVTITQNRLYLAVRPLSGSTYAVGSTPVGLAEGRMGIEIESYGSGLRARAVWEGEDPTSAATIFSPWTEEVRTDALYLTNLTLTDQATCRLRVGLQDARLSGLLLAHRPGDVDDTHGSQYLSDYYRTDSIPKSASLALSDSPLEGLVAEVDMDGWGSLQAIASATQGAMWLSERGPVYQNRHQMRGAQGVVDSVDARDSLEDIPWRVSVDDMADRVEVTYGGVQIQEGGPNAGDDQVEVWSLSEKIRIPAKGTVTVKAEWDGAVQGLVDFVSAYSTTLPGTLAGYSVYGMAYNEAGGGTQPPNLSISVEAIQTGPSSADLIVRSNDAKVLWLVNGVGDPTLVLRARRLVTSGQPLTLAAGLSADDAVNTLPLNLQPWVQDTAAAQDILGWAKAQTERPLPVLQQVSIRPNAARQIGDVVALIDTLESGLDSKVMLSSLTTSVAPGSFKQDADLTLLDPTFYDLDDAFSDTYEAQAVTLVNSFHAGEYIDHIDCVSIPDENTSVTAPGNGWLNFTAEAGSVAAGSRVALAPYDDDRDTTWMGWLPPTALRLALTVRFRFQNTSASTLYVRPFLRWKDDGVVTDDLTNAPAYTTVAAGATVEVERAWVQPQFRPGGWAVPALLVSSATPGPAMVAGRTWKIQKVATYLGHAVFPVTYFSGDGLGGNLVSDPNATVAGSWDVSAGTTGVAGETMVTGASDGPVLDDGTEITTYARYTWSTANTTTPINAGYVVTGQGMPVHPGDLVSGSIYFRCSAVPTNARVGVRFWNGSNVADITGATTTPTAGAWHKIGFEDVVVPAGVSGANAVRVIISRVMSIGTTLDVTVADLKIVPPDGTEFSWAAERGRSPSIRSEYERVSWTFDDFDEAFADMTFDEFDAWVSKFSNLRALEGDL